MILTMPVLTVIEARKLLDKYRRGKILAPLANLPEREAVKVSVAIGVIFKATQELADLYIDLGFAREEGNKKLTQKFIKKIIRLRADLDI